MSKNLFSGTGAFKRVQSKFREVDAYSPPYYGASFFGSPGFYPEDEEKAVRLMKGRIIEVSDQVEELSHSISDDEFYAMWAASYPDGAEYNSLQGLPLLISEFERLSGLKSALEIRVSGNFRR